MRLAMSELVDARYTPSVVLGEGGLAYAGSIAPLAYHLPR